MPSILKILQYKDKYEKVMSLPPEKSDNAQRVIRIHNFIASWPQINPGAVSKVLDIGAGTGVFLARFLEEAKKRKYNWNGVAVESDPIASDHLRSLKLFDVIEGEFPISGSPLNNFDLCTLNKIVEHIPEPVQFLKKVAEALSPKSGLLYIEVPDELTINYRPPVDNILGSLHRHLYNPRSLAYLLDAAGFETIEVVRLFEPSGKISVAAFATLRSAIHSLVAK
ncbi:class I SAM-dependent methyltransferase [Candidatus Peregrinibacteria bacterium]|nr:class I SAM-dependent methyltransferase [Candidatus Peregrinibacteria bacterium]